MAGEAHKARVTAAVKDQEAQLAAIRSELDTHVNSNRRAGCADARPCLLLPMRPLADIHILGLIWGLRCQVPAYRLLCATDCQEA